MTAPHCLSLIACNAYADAMALAKQIAPHWEMCTPTERGAWECAIRAVREQQGRQHEKSFRLNRGSQARQPSIFKLTESLTVDSPQIREMLIPRLGNADGATPVFCTEQQFIAVRNIPSREATIMRLVLARCGYQYCMSCKAYHKPFKATT